MACQITYTLSYYMKTVLYHNKTTPKIKNMCMDAYSSTLLHIVEGGLINKEHDVKLFYACQLK